MASEALIKLQFDKPSQVPALVEYPQHADTQDQYQQGISVNIPMWHHIDCDRTEKILQ